MYSAGAAAAAPQYYQQQQQQEQPQGSAQAAAAAADPSLVYVSFEEKKDVSDHRKPVRKSGGGHTYTVKFYLVDTHGVEHLAACGEDQGDAHYLYGNVGAYPFLRANNKNVRGAVGGGAWGLRGPALELCCLEPRAASPARQQLTMSPGCCLPACLRAVLYHVVTDAVPADPNQIRLPKFVGHRWVGGL